MELTDLQKKIIRNAMILPIMEEITKALKDCDDIDISEDELDEEMENIMYMMD